MVVMALAGIFPFPSKNYKDDDWAMLDHDSYSYLTSSNSRVVLSSLMVVIYKPK